MAPPKSTFKVSGIQRRKQYPTIAYRSSEVIKHDVEHVDTTDLRARSEERESTLAPKSGPRSRSAEPSTSRQQQKQVMVQSYPPISSRQMPVLSKGEELPIVCENISETTEYKSQFAWPRKSDEIITCTARKSISMSVIKSTDDTDLHPLSKPKLAPVHRPCVQQKDVTADEKHQESKKKIKTEYKAKYKPFTSYVYVDGQWKKSSRLKIPEKQKTKSHEPWFVEVVERLQKANEYRWRGHGHSAYGEGHQEAYKQSPETAISRFKVAPPEYHISLPKVHHSSVKKPEIKKKEFEAIPEMRKKEQYSGSIHNTKREKLQKSTIPRRPKSAEPTKAKEQVKYKRPATTPPTKSSSRSSPPKKSLPKSDEVDKKLKARQCALKRKEVTTKPLSSANKPLHASSAVSPGSGGKVWLQADQPVEAQTEAEKSIAKEHSDAVRPSTLLPSSVSQAPQEDQARKMYNDVEEEIGEIIPHVTSKQGVPHSTVVPLTHVRTPEEVTGVKSPDPENWTVPIESSEKLEWNRVNIPEVPSQAIKSADEISEKLAKISSAHDPVPHEPSSQESTSVSSTSKITSANVLERARSRLDQFWGKK